LLRIEGVSPIVVDMAFSPEIVELLGTSRVAHLEEGLTRIRACVALVPDRATWVKHLPIPLAATTPTGANDELVDRLRKSGPDWFFVTGVRPDGTRFGYASDRFRPHEPHSGAYVGQFLLFDLHSSLTGWWVSHVWRAADLAEATCASMESWHVLQAAACVRALLEGVAAFVIEGEALLAEWSAFKQRGVPDIAAVSTFRDQFQKRLLQAQFGSRLGEREGKGSTSLKRTNVMTLLEKLSKRDGCNVLPAYEWLCDAVHPSFGFHTVYVATQGVHKSESTMAADLARRADKARTNIPKIDPTVAWAVADAFTISTNAFLAEVPRLRWLIDDVGLTTGIGYSSPTFSGGNILNTRKTGECPCGSGRRAEECRHAWGVHTEPPSFL
jgi:hypothetical protein